MVLNLEPWQIKWKESQWLCEKQKYWENYIDQHMKMVTAE
jgi:hypothetical protein